MVHGQLSTLIINVYLNECPHFQIKFDIKQMVVELGVFVAGGRQILCQSMGSGGICKSILFTSWGKVLLLPNPNST